jgi:HlyD family secretion protein
MLGEEMRRTGLVLLALLALGGGWLLFGRGSDGERPRYVVEPVNRGSITATVTATGTVNPVATVQVGTYVSGPIQELFADFNTPVTRGQRLAKIDARPFQVKVEAAAAELANARAKLDKDRADAALKAVTLHRTRDLRGRGIVAESDLDLALSQHRQAQAQVELGQAEIRSAEARLREAEVNLAYTDIVSPVDGVVVSRSVDVGQTVAATFQTPTLFLVAEDLTKMQVSASVSESDIGGVAAGQDVTFAVDAYPATVFRGRVAQVRNAPVTLLNVVTYDVVVSVDNADLRLKPGMTANVTITTATRADALRVATSALRFRPPAHAAGKGAAAAAEPQGRAARVWVLDESGQPRAVPVETGIADDRFTELTGGLSEGDRVIVALERVEPPAVTGRGPSFAPAPRGRRP